MSELAICVHGDQVVPIAEAQARHATLAQFFLGDPQAWKGPAVAYEGGAAAVIVHGGHLGKNDDPAIGLDNWRKCIERLQMPVPLLIENTAGGDNAMARRLHRIAQLWDAIGGAEGGETVGFCLDTCHAHE